MREDEIQAARYRARTYDTSITAARDFAKHAPGDVERMADLLLDAPRSRDDDFLTAADVEADRDLADVAREYDQAEPDKLRALLEVLSENDALDVDTLRTLMARAGAWERLANLDGLRGQDTDEVLRLVENAIDAAEDFAP